MPVTECVNHQDVDRSGHSQEVGPGTGENVPRIGVEDTGNDVDTVGRHQRDQNDTTTTGTEEGRNEGPKSLVEVEIHHTTGERPDHKVKGQDEDIELDEGEVEERQRVEEFGTGPVSLAGSIISFGKHTPLVDYPALE